MGMRTCSFVATCLEVASVFLGLAGCALAVLSTTVVIAASDETAARSSRAGGLSLGLVGAGILSRHGARRARRAEEESVCLRLLDEGPVRPASLAPVLGVTNDEAVAIIARVAAGRLERIELDADDDGLFVRARA